MDLKGIIALVVVLAIVGIIVYRNWPSAKSRANQKSTEKKNEPERISFPE